VVGPQNYVGSGIFSGIDLNADGLTNVIASDIVTGGFRLGAAGLVFDNGSVITSGFETFQSELAGLTAADIVVSSGTYDPVVFDLNGDNEMNAANDNKYLEYNYTDYIGVLGNVA